MVTHHSVIRPAFNIAGKKTHIDGQNNEQFGSFWEQCQKEGLFELLESVSRMQPGLQTGGVTLGVSLVSKNPDLRSFYYMICVELPEGAYTHDLEVYQVPAAQWEVFDCTGRVPDSIVTAEIFAFTEWLPASGYEHDNAPEMEVYLPGGGKDNSRCEFWLPVRKASRCQR